MPTINLTNGDDNFTDNTAGDTINALDGNDIVHANGDTIFGGNGDDSLYGDSGANALYGGSGDDSFFSTGGNDTIDGGSGIDTWNGNYSASSSNLTFTQTGAGAYTLTGGTVLSNVEAISLSLGSGDDTVNLTSFPLGTFNGGGGNNTLNLNLSSDANNTTVFFNDGNQIYDTTGSYIYFSNFQTLGVTTGAGDDVFNIIGGNGYVFHLNGGGGSNTATINLSADTANISFTLNTASNTVSTFVGDGSSLENIQSIVLIAGLGNDTFTGGSGDDSFNITGGNDTIDGGSGIDTWNGNYSASSSNLTFTQTGAGAYTLTGGTVLSNVEAISLSLGSGDDTVNLTSFPLGTFNGGGGNNTLNLNLSSDANNTTVFFNDGNQIYDTTGSYIYFSNFQTLGVTTGAGDDVFNIIGGNGYVFHLNGGGGSNTATINLSADTANISFTLNTASNTVSTFIGDGSTIENIQTLTRLIAGSGDDTLTGAAGNDVFDGGTGNNALYGGAGDDTLYSHGGVDTIDGGAGINTWTGDYSASSANLTFTQTGANAFTMSNGTTVSNIQNVSLTAGSGDDTFSVNSLSPSQDQLNGGSGTNTLNLNLGSSPNDTNVSYGGGFGPNTTYAIDAYGSLVARQISTANITTGSGDDNVYVANAVGDSITLNGGAGTDTLHLNGQQANYSVVSDGSGGYIVTDNVGTDGLEHLINFETIQFSDSQLSLITGPITGTPGPDTLNGTAGDDLIQGLGGNDVLNGLGGNDTLNGGAGADTLNGGTGVDTADYHDSPGAVTINLGSVKNGFSAGTGGDAQGDQLQGIENVTGSAFADKLTGDANANVLTGLGGADNLTGGAGDDVLYGGDGDDKLNGGLGADTMVGGTGNDSYTVDNTGDVIIENPGEGTDKVSSSVTFTLGPNIESLTLTGTANIDGTGDDLANKITGNTGNNSLYGGAGDDKIDGGAGADIMYGGTGNDSFTVDNVGDQVIENPGEGNDKVSASVSFTLGPNVESLTLTGTANIDGTGNELANKIGGNTGNNVLTGGAGADSLSGGDGDDILIGGTGKDKLTGGNGADTFEFGPAVATDADSISDFTHGVDKLAFHSGDYSLAVGALDPGNLVFGTAATDHHHEFVYDATHKALLWDPDGVGGAAAISVATFSTAITLSASDFIILA